MGNPNHRRPKAACQQTTPAALPSSEEVARLSEPRNLGEHAGRPDQVLKVGLGQVGNRWPIGKLWERALYEQSVDLGKIKCSIKALVDAKLSITPATKGLSTSYVYLTSYGIAIGFPTVFKRDMATHCFRDWTMNFIPGATIENPGSLTSQQTERASFAIYYIDIRDIKAQFLEDLERFEALLAKRRAKEKVPETLESALRVRLQGHYDEFSRKNPLVYRDRSWSPVRYRVLSIRQITNRFGVKTDTWKIEVDSKKAAEVITQEGMVIWFFGAETNGAYRWKNKEPAVVA
ncbi:hypothetical protein BGX38DRAFT_1151370 [Terfezia claveryi]|nr:hypothetical protein BGX38DRAFT_1151370 [Terfezia claveryi]